MRYVSAYLLATLGGNNSPSEKDLEAILSSVGIDFDAELAKKVVSELKGKKIEDLVAEGHKKLATIPSGGGGAPAAGGAAAAAGGAEPAKEEVKETKKEEEEEEDDGDMGFGLFD